MKNVLIYNQKEANMEALKIFLAQEGYQVFVVNRLEDVIQRVGAKDIHVVVMDIDFPKNDGIERLKAIRNADRMPIIVLSENDREQMKIAALNAGADDNEPVPSAGVYGEGELPVQKVYAACAYEGKHRQDLQGG